MGASHVQMASRSNPKKMVQSHFSEMMPYLKQLALLRRRLGRYIFGGASLSPRLQENWNRRVDIRDAQYPTLYVSAAGLKMWLFTLRSAMHDELRPVGAAQLLDVENVRSLWVLGASARP
jgi:hypothetical protein